jgi:hypothetical protein
MLVLDVYVNEQKIDQIQLLNTGEKDRKKGHLYHFVKPEDKNHLMIWHKREDGWTVLVEKALRLYNKDEI